MKDRTLAIIVGAVALILAAGGFYAWREGLFASAPPPPPPPAVDAVPPGGAAPAAPEHHPVPPPEDAAQPLPLPALADSDALVRQTLAEVFGQETAEREFVRQNLVRRIVVTIDNLPRGKLTVEQRPVVPTGLKFLVTGTDDKPVIDERNFERYSAAVSAVAALDTRRLASAYFRLYPLFQSAYEALGYPSAYFNDRLIAVIDHLLDTPEMSGPIALIQPSVYYEFADPELESRSAGQKLLLRMGPANAGIIKRKLRELRAALTAGHGPAATSAPAGGA
jgi:hypothetical protein